jgi:phage shock protein PspC (stress-responsive transcriptional regulator)
LVIAAEHFGLSPVLLQVIAVTIGVAAEAVGF